MSRLDSGNLLPLKGEKGLLEALKGEKALLFVTLEHKI